MSKLVWIFCLVTVLVSAEFHEKKKHGVVALLLFLSIVICLAGKFVVFGWVCLYKRGESPQVWSRCSARYCYGIGSAVLKIRYFFCVYFYFMYK